VVPQVGGVGGGVRGVEISLTMGVNSLPKTVTRQSRDGDLNPGPSATRLTRRATELNSGTTMSRLDRLR